MQAPARPETMEVMGRDLGMRRPSSGDTRRWEASGGNGRQIYHWRKQGRKPKVSRDQAAAKRK